MQKILCLCLFGANVVAYAADNGNLCAPNTKGEDITRAVKWYRDSAEKNALYNEVYTIGGNYVEQWVKTHHPKPKSWGVILDIDETVLDNSWYMAACGDSIVTESDFSHYVANPQKSVALPGATTFLNRVHKLGGWVSLISNRDGSFSDNSGKVMEATIANLKAQHIYFDQVVLADRLDAKVPEDKNPRFEAVISGKYDDKQMVWSNTLPAHNVIAYFGDNIQDFPKLKQRAVNEIKADDRVFIKFGNGYFIFANPLYGSWQSNEYK